MLSFTEYLIESQGLTGRKTGETFVDKDGKSLIFQKVEFFDTLKDAGNISDATPVNKPLSNLTGVGVVSFKAESGKIVKFIKYIKPKTTKWDNSNPNYFNYKSKATAKEQSGLKPSDFLTKMDNLSMKDILDQVGKAFGKVSPLYTATKQAIAGDPISIVIGDLSESGITNYFAEILQPIALINDYYTGNAKDGIKVMTGTDDLTKFKINFPKGVTQGLYDSYLTSSDSQINISSKYGSTSLSAKASVTNLYKIYKEYKDKEIFSEFETAIEIIRIIAEVDAETAPLELAVLLDRKTSNFNFSNTEKNNVMKLKTDPSVKLTQNIIKLRDTIKPGSGKTPPAFNHVLAGIAKSVCEYINVSAQDLQFSRFASLLLNGTVIQVFTKVQVVNGVIKFNKFDTKWPDDAVTKVMLESATRYKTDRVDGKIGYVVKSK
jgi:hypothetical protein